MVCGVDHAQHGGTEQYARHQFPQDSGLPYLPCECPEQFRSTEDKHQYAQKPRHIEMVHQCIP